MVAADLASVGPGAAGAPTGWNYVVTRRFTVQPVSRLRFAASLRTAGSGAGRPPLAEAPARLVLTQRTLVQPELEEEGERLAHHAAGRDAELGHHRVAVEVGPDGGQLL